MSIATLLVLTAVVGSVVLVAQSTSRTFPLVALVASGLEALLAFRVVSFSVSGVNILFLLALALLVGGGASWMHATAKPSVTAATAVAMVGAVQVLGALL
jgi:hypothetical protein